MGRRRILQLKPARCSQRIVVDFLTHDAFHESSNTQFSLTVFPSMIAMSIRRFILPNDPGIPLIRHATLGVRGGEIFCYYFVADRAAKIFRPVFAFPPLALVCYSLPQRKVVVYQQHGFGSKTEERKYSDLSTRVRCVCPICVYAAHKLSETRVKLRPGGGRRRGK